MAWQQAFDAVHQQLDALRDQTDLPDRAIAEAIRAAGWRQEVTAPIRAHEDHQDVIFRLAWWLFVRAPSLDVRYFLTGPMSLDLVVSEDRALDELLAELRQVERAHDDSDDTIDTAEIRTDFLDDHLDTFRQHARLVDRVDQLTRAELEGPVSESIAKILANEDDFRTLYADLTDHFVEEFDELARSGAFEDVMHGEAYDHQPQREYEELDSASAYVTRAEKRFANGELHGAMDDCNAALELDPDCVEAYLQRGVARAAHDDVQDAIVDFGEALQRDPDHVGALINRGLALYGDEQFDAALDDFDRAAEMDDQAPEVFANRGIARVAVDDHAGAEDDFNRAISLDPQSVIAHANRATVHRARGHTREAIDDYQKAIEIDDTYAEAWAALGFIFLNGDYYHEAIDHLSRAIELQPYAGQHYYNRGTAHAGLEEYEDAIDDYTQAIEIDDEDIESLLNRGLARLKLQDFRGAIDDWNRAIEVDPYNPMPYAKRAGVWNLLDEPVEAAQDLHQALELAPNEWEYADFAHEMLNDIIEQMGYDPAQKD